MKNYFLSLFLLFFVGLSYSQQLEPTWDQGVPLCPEDKYISGLIDKLGDRTLGELDSLTDGTNMKIFREIGFAFYDKGMYDAADWYLKRAKKYKERVEIEKAKPKPSEQDLKKMESDLKFLEDLPKSYKNLSKGDMLKLVKMIDKKITELSKERDSILKTKNPDQELITTKNASIESLNKEKDVINLTIEGDELKTETKGLKKYIWWLAIGLSILTLAVIVLSQRKTIKIKDTEIDKQLRDINKKNKYLEYSARIIRHDMHSGINTYIPRGLSSLEKKVTNEDIEKLKIAPAIKMIKEGLNHTQKVYKRVYEFTNLVKQQVVLDKTNVDLKKLLTDYFSNTSYKEQVYISDLINLDVNPTLFCSAIENLVKNGLQYNDNKNKEIKIYIDSNNIIIEDNGIGLTQKDLESFTGKYLNKKGESETGLGLSISKTILEEHGFTMSCKSDKNGTLMKIKIK
jgi:signal transduction histidine kinase